MSDERLAAAQHSVSELKRHNEQLVERSSAAQRELTQERLGRAQLEVQVKSSQQVSWRRMEGKDGVLPGGGTGEAFC